MKFVFLLSLISTFAFAQLGKIDESVYIKSYDKKLIKLIESHPELIIDHASHDGFELYGPKGTKKWLDQISVSYTKISEGHHGHSHGFKGAGAKAAASYPTFAELTQNLQTLAARFPKITKLFSIGKSVEGRDLWVMKISDNVELDEVEPEFKYISSMHGDEITGRELTQFLIKDMLEAYGTDQRITDLINNTEIYIMPSMNPDGSKKERTRGMFTLPGVGRPNANRVDLNRNFPNWIAGEPNTTRGRQPETVAVMNFQKVRQFSLSANFHGGAVVVNYPWDSSQTRHPLDHLLQEISLIYANENPSMRTSTRFNRGITNGADWYVLRGGMQDWSYIWHNDLQVTVELSIDKWPNYSRIPSFYQENKESMLKYIEAIHMGAGFKLNNNDSGEVKVIGSNGDLGTYKFKEGEFYKVLPEGDYRFEVQAGNRTYQFNRNVVKDRIKPNGNY